MNSKPSDPGCGHSNRATYEATHLHRLASQNVLQPVLSMNRYRYLLTGDSLR